MFIEHIDTATAAAFQLGYENPSQFSCEYSCLFCGPLLRDIKNLHQMSPAKKAFEFEEADKKSFIYILCWENITRDHKN